MRGVSSRYRLAAEALGRIGTPGESGEVVEALEEAAADEVPEVRHLQTVRRLLLMTAMGVSQKLLRVYVPFLLRAGVLCAGLVAVAGCAREADLTRITPQIGELLSYPPARIEFRLGFEVRDDATAPPYDGSPSRWRPPVDVLLSYMTYSEAQMVACSYVPFEFPPGGLDERWCVATDRAREELARLLYLMDSERTAALWQQRVKPSSAEDAVRLAIAWLHDGPVYNRPVYEWLSPPWSLSREGWPNDAEPVPGERARKEEEIVICEVLPAPFWVVSGSDKPPSSVVLSALRELVPDGDDVLQAFALLCLSDVYASVGRYEDAVRVACGVSILKVSDSLKWSAVLREAYCHLASDRPERAMKALRQASLILDRSACPGLAFGAAYYTISDQLEERSSR